MSALGGGGRLALRVLEVMGVGGGRTLRPKSGRRPEAASVEAESAEGVSEVIRVGTSGISRAAGRAWVIEARVRVVRRRKKFILRVEAG